MSTYDTSDTRKATDRRYRLRRYTEGRCRRCSQPRLDSGPHCATCQAKENARRSPPSFQHREMRYALNPRLLDRRQNGQPHAALGWALLERTV